MRYVGQGYELTVPAAGDFLDAFHRAHERRYGYADPSWHVELVNVRSRFIGRTPGLPIRPRREVRRAADAVAIGRRKSIFPDQGSLRPVMTTLYDRARLLPGYRLTGPAAIFEYSATTVIPPGWKARMDRYENLILEPVRR